MGVFGVRGIDHTGEDDLGCGPGIHSSTFANILPIYNTSIIITFKNRE